MSENKSGEKQNIITIDGPSGVGKSSVSRKIAAATGFTYLDTGAMYRGVGWHFLHHKVSLDDVAMMAAKLAELELELLPAPDESSDVGVLVNGENVSAAIRTPEMAMVASRVSAIPVVREILTSIQRNYGEKGKIVAEGRDTGTIVFPRAAYKFFLDAEPEERARRRVLQLQATGVVADFNQILSMTLERDKNDSERAIAPLSKALDAHCIDTTGITIQQVVEKILQIIADTGR
ncbi:(d)CMP kinase [Desulfopila sp. IMCC35006]|uniref:(d)CMP kinase n=1 Tax=Desulfopila sp. IMCC35006 TaxID=2569542 RepID=UPI0010AD68E6|nr:(d)CMP kinase [Desulfopila sp. IMCC35006]TKB26277.1 (d)CMP kinase [Desulfopila sp. IMCC35006]